MIRGAIRRYKIKLPFVMENYEYDVVIVGSGIAGAILAKTLIDAGKKVLMLEAGLESGMKLGGDEAYQNQVNYLQTFYKATAKTPNSPYPKIKNAPSPDVLDVKPLDKEQTGYFVQKGPLPFGSDNLIGPGGTTMHWLGTTLRMLPNDFKVRSLYGTNQDGTQTNLPLGFTDWPITYTELIKYYEMAENEIGVSGDVSDQNLPNMGNNYFSENYVFPMKKISQSYLDKKMMEKTQGLPVSMGSKSYNLTCCSTPQGRNSVPNENYNFTGVEWDTVDNKLKLSKRQSRSENYEPVGALWDPYTGQRCEGNASCVPICPVQAKYNALKTLKKAKQRNSEKLNIISQAVAFDLIIDEYNNLIQGIRYKKYETADSFNYTTHVARARIYVLAASAIENAKLLLASDVANSSDQVGRNLMDHLCLLTWGIFPEKVYPFRGPGSTTNISTFRDGEFRKNHAPWIVPIDNWGWGWPEFSPGTDVSEAVEKGLFGQSLRNELNKNLTRQVLLHFECEQEPDPNNRVTIDPQYLDRLDNYRPVIHYNVSEYMMKAFESARFISDQIFQSNEITDSTEYHTDEPDNVIYKGVPYTFRGAGHIVGTHRMGTNKENSVVNSDQRTWDHRNLFVVGCGSMPTLGTSNPTLTMAALAFKACEAILLQLNN